MIIRTHRLRIALLALGLALGMVAIVPAAPTEPATPDLEQDWRLQMIDLAGQIAERGKIFGQYSESEIYNQHAIIHADDKTPVHVVLRRTGALLDHLVENNTDIDATTYRRKLNDLKTKAQALPAPDVKIPKRSGKEWEMATLNNADAFFPLFKEVMILQREIAFKNPLLDFDKITFVKRNPPAMAHMCDEWYGRVSEPGGGLYILNNPWSDKPTLSDLIKDNPVQNGQYAGKVLEPGAFITPELDYDGKTIYFAYSGNKESFIEKYKSVKSTWGLMQNEYFHSPETAYHIFRVGVDGSDLTQITEGAWNDFYPCVLPSGRVVFLSERRGGEGRCHPRPCPTYVMHSMFPDGSDIVPISYHEINEWSPVVTNKGRLIYSRWDYLDRGFSKGQYPWFSDPDGRNVRAFYGNYEGGGGSVHADLRPVPDSSLFFGTEYGHHAASYGTLVVADGSKVDNYKSNVPKYLTPETQPYNKYSNRGAFTTPYPLSETTYLCTWSPDARLYTLNGMTKNYEKPEYPHGIYLMDAYGNKILLYRDAEISANLPYPVRVRQRQHIMPHSTATGAPKDQKPLPTDPDTANVTIMNVYESELPWPEGRKIDKLRIVQVLPKSSPGASNPPINYDREIVARQVLGTVPIEEDGSVNFTLKAGIPVFFQVLDENGLAIQSMRSSMYAMPGESLSCLGCHEPKGKAGDPGKASMAKALNREPSTITPGPEGSKPMTFARLVQPVLDEKCVKCHLEHPEKAPDLRADGELAKGLEQRAKEKALKIDKRNWTTSYLNLWPYAFAYNTRAYSEKHYWSVKPSKMRTIPGKVGAYVAPLYELLTTGSHKDKVKLTPEEMERLVVWLDTQSVFYGAYHKTREQKSGEAVEPEVE
ncbi:MAG: hypothetical protein ACLFUS_02460 [Candidatus Sumerlaeia bacterium]